MSVMGRTGSLEDKNSPPPNARAQTLNIFSHKSPGVSPTARSATTQTQAQGNDVLRWNTQLQSTPDTPPSLFQGIDSQTRDFSEFGNQPQFQQFSLPQRETYTAPSFTDYSHPPADQYSEELDFAQFVSAPPQFQPQQFDPYSSGQSQFDYHSQFQYAQPTQNQYQYQTDPQYQQYQQYQQPPVNPDYDSQFQPTHSQLPRRQKRSKPKAKPATPEPVKPAVEIPYSNTRKVEYTPYTLSDFKQLTPVKMGSLGVDLDRRELREKREKQRQVREFARMIRMENAQRIMKAPPAKPQKEEPKPTARDRALEFAKHIPKPKVYTSQRNASAPLSRSSSQYSDVNASHLPSKLDQLAQRHQQARRDIEAIRAQFAVEFGMNGETQQLINRNPAQDPNDTVMEVDAPTTATAPPPQPSLRARQPQMEIEYDDESCNCIRVVLDQYERLVVFKLGKLHRTVYGPGIVVMIPCVDSWEVVDLRVRVVNVHPQDVMTKDSVSIRVDAVVLFNVFDPIKSVTKVQNVDESTQQMAQTALRSVLGERELDEAMQNRQQIADLIQGRLKRETGVWGVHVKAVEIRDLSLPEQMRRSMASQAETERERRAKVISSEAEAQAAANLSEAAQLMSQNQITMQLRYLQTLDQLTDEKNSKLIFPVPISFRGFFPPSDDVKQEDLV